jgi:hypothetical protein
MGDTLIIDILEIYKKGEINHRLDVYAELQKIKYFDLPCHKYSALIDRLIETGVLGESESADRYLYVDPNGLLDKLKKEKKI